MALIATAASSVMADSTVIWESTGKGVMSECKAGEEAQRTKLGTKLGAPYQDLFSTVVFLLNLLAKVSLRQTEVLSHLPTVLEQ